MSQNDQKYNYSYNYNYQNSPGPGPNTPGSGAPRRGRRGNDNQSLVDTLSWIADIALLFIVPPLGLILTIAQATGNNLLGSIYRGMRGSGQKPASGGARYTSPSGAASGAKASGEEPKTASSADAESSRQAAQTTQSAAPSVRRADTGAKALNVFGWLLVAFGIAGLVTKLGAGTLWSLLTAAAVAAGGCALLYAAAVGRKKEARFKSCLNVTGTSGLVELDKLSRTLGLDPGQTDRLLSEMIERGYYGPKAYLDHQRRLLVVDPRDMRDVFRAEDEAQKTKAEERERASQSEYDRILAQIRQADADIADEAMSEKIRRMQTVTAAIFREVEAHPEKKPQLRRFMDYYLPTTLKLLNSYARIEKQGVSGENMAKAKADIERIADTLVQGYEKQLDTLYQTEAVDIAGDVSVIENMMKRDGLSGEKDFGTPQGGH